MSHSFYDEIHVIFHDGYDDDIIIKNKETGLEVNTTIQDLYLYQSLVKDDNCFYIPDNLISLSDFSVEFIESFLFSFIDYKIRCKLDSCSDINDLKTVIADLSKLESDEFKSIIYEK